MFPIYIYTGTASAAMWTFRAEGRLFHSGLPHKVYKRYMYMYMCTCMIVFPPKCGAQPLTIYT